MYVSKLKAISGLIVLIAFLLLSCSRSATKNEKDVYCRNFIAGKQGFYIQVTSNTLVDNDVVFRMGDQRLIPKNIQRKSSSEIMFFLDGDLRLTDTLTITYGGEDHKIYDFKNVTETATDGSNHEKVDICRVATATISGKEIPDSNNNILILKMK